MKGGKVDQDRPRQKPHMRAGDFSCSALFELQAGKELSFRAARACCHKLPSEQQPASSLLGGNGEKLQGVLSSILGPLLCLDKLGVVIGDGLLALLQV